ncbi:hypothetical protein BH11BAC1_BH11BAC1_14860 [soil metagenome]
MSELKIWAKSTAPESLISRDALKKIEFISIIFQNSGVFLNQFVFTFESGIESNNQSDMKINLHLLCFGFIFSGTVGAQSLSPAVISPGGGFSANGSAMLSSTVGEMVMVETFNNNSVILTQGFQQPEDLNVTVKDVEHSFVGITVSPNPSQGLIKLVFKTSEELDLSIVIYDISGQRVYQTEARKATQNNFIALDLSAFAAGEYIIECKSIDNSKSVPVFLSQKINLAR